MDSVTQLSTFRFLPGHVGIGTLLDAAVGRSAGGNQAALHKSQRSIDSWPKFRPARLMGESLGDDRGVEYAILVPSALADHSITVFDLADVNIVSLLAAVLLTDPSGRAVVSDGLLLAGTHLANGQCRFILTAP